MENCRRSQRVSRRPKKYRLSSSDESFIETENSNVRKRVIDDSVDVTKELVEKLSQLNTSTKRIITKRILRRNKNSSSDEEETNEIQVKSLNSKQTRRNIQEVSNILINENDSDSNNSDSDSKIVGRPSQVLFEDEAVSGKSMFGFQKSKRRGGMVQRAFEVVNSPYKSCNTPKSIGNTSNINKTLRTPRKTPQSLRNQLSKNVIEDSFEDFSDSGSEYKLSNSASSESESNSEEEENDNSSSSDNESDAIAKSCLPKRKSKHFPSSTTRNTENLYVMKSDDYFSWQSSKIVTSNHTLQKLKNPKLSEQELQKLLTSCSLNSHEKEIRKMLKLNCDSSSFSEWMYLLQEGFNILIYGLGSKRSILKAFHKEMLNSSPVIVVNGYFPSLTIKDIIDGILLDIFEDTNSPANIYEAVEIIRKQCGRQKDINFYIIVHNIDGPMLRNNKSQNILSSLAEIANIHLLASIDHINTPLIWDHYKLSKFNFIWWDVTSFLPYTDETSFESSMLVQRSGALALSSLGNVYQSLTKNSKGIFMLIVKYQLNNKSVKYYQGMPFKVLYSQCRENFLVSSDLALRTQLTEFLDHKLVKSKRSTDGVEHLLIPIHNSLLQQFLEQLS